MNQLALEEENLQVQKEVLQNIKDLRSEVKKNDILMGYIEEKKAFQVSVK